MEEDVTSARSRIHRRTIVLLCAGFLVAGLIALATWHSTKKDDPPRSRGLSVVAIINGRENMSGSYLNCRGASDFSAFNPGQHASLLDAAGNLIGVSVIGDSQEAIDRLSNEEELLNGGTGLVSDIEKRAREKVTKPLSDASGYACAFHMLFTGLSLNGLYNVEVGTHRFPVDISAAPLFNSLMWTVN